MKPTIRIGSGFDVHRLENGETLILGGVLIPHEKGTVAHSDGDVVLHTLCDALLGAAGLRDIGFHFPDNSSEFKDISSMVLLERTYKLIQEKGYKLGNADITICLEKPKLKDHIEQMRENISEVLKVDISDIAIKATTTEKLGYVGDEKGIATYATCLIYS